MNVSTLNETLFGTIMRMHALSYTICHIHVSDSSYNGLTLLQKMYRPYVTNDDMIAYFYYYYYYLYRAFPMRPKALTIKLKNNYKYIRVLV